MTGPENTPVGRGPEGRGRLAHALREARGHAGISGVRAGAQAGMSQSKISKIERSLLLPSVDDVAALCRVYEVPENERAELLALAESLREEASTRVILARRVPAVQQRVAQIEAKSSLVRSFQPLMVFGILQTYEYSRCLYTVPRYKVPVEEAEAAIRLRQGRRQALTTGSTRYRLIMSEGALRWQAGSAELMAKQVEDIAEVARSGGQVGIGIIPWSTPVRIFPRNAFHIYDEDAVMVGTETATATLTGTADISTYVELFGELEKLADFGDDAVAHLERIASEYRQLARS
ncbi:helix-turn-helix domain-containing protein [Nocardiopsis alba]|uniref:helix-turn-helix domain-containing protein n=1 Tax=Nocardiopsis alba TaxID=53437 RepID=UPI0033DB86E2